MREIVFFSFFQTSVHVYAFTIYKKKIVCFEFTSSVPSFYVFDESLNAGCYLFHTPPEFDVI